MGTLGHKVFVPVDATPAIISNDPAADKAEPVLYLKPTKAKTTGRRTSDAFVVFKGSEVSAIPTKSCPDTIQHLCDQYADRVNADNVLTEDMLFSSPVAAADFVTYVSANGLIMWVTNESKLLCDIESEEE